MQSRRMILSLLGSIIIVAVASALYLSTLNKKEEIPELVIHLDQDKCHRCGMLISDRRYAAAMFLKGERDFRKYDDVGCMLVEYNQIDKSRIMAVIVHDYNSGKPLKAENAWFAVAPKNKLITPMGYGVVALEKYEDAEQIAKQYGGKVLDWKGLVENINIIIGG